MTNKYLQFILVLTIISHSGQTIAVSHYASQADTVTYTTLSEIITEQQIGIKQWDGIRDLGVAPVDVSASVVVLNPYRGVNWKTVNQYKANLHTHTTNSDGYLYPHEVVDLYQTAGYKILSITDHSTITFPWTDFSSLNKAYNDRDPVKLGMLAVQGNELSDAHHVGSYIHAVPGGGANLDEAFSTMTRLTGLAAFKHPGRYWNIRAAFQPGELYSIDWYQDYYQRFPAIVGMEVFNLGDRFHNDRILWDELLTRLMPERPIWGHSNDDMHKSDQLFRNYNYKLMPELTLEALRTSMTSGASFFVYEPTGDGKSKVPRIDSVTVDLIDEKIIIHALNFDQIEWISGISGRGTDRKSNVLAMGDTFDYNGFDKSYIRAVVSNKYGQIFTQPFGFTNQKPAETGSIEIIRYSCSSNVLLSVPWDHTALEYHWTLPGDATILQGENSHSIQVDFGQFSGIADVQVFKSNTLGVSNTSITSFEIEALPEQPTIQRVNDILVSDTEKGNQWYDLTGPVNRAMDQNFIPTLDGDYYVVVTRSGCKSKESNSISIITEKANALDKEKAALIFPNPFTSELLIEPGLKEGGVSYEIINITGRVMIKGIAQEQTRINTEPFPKGIYFIRIDNDIETKTLKIIRN
jgi:hypothetical protein